MKRTLGALLFLVLPLAAAASMGCATSFRGNAHFPGGPGACFSHCAGQRMQMLQYVYVGDYSSACVCGVIPVQASNAAASGAAVAAAAGVMTQMQEAQARR